MKHRGNLPPSSGVSKDMKTRLLVLIAALALASAACGSEDPISAGAEASPTPRSTAQASPTPDQTPDPDEGYEASDQIVVRRPASGDRVASPVRIAGEANVYEATVSLRLVTADGEVLVEDFTTATCGSGCWGDYGTRLAFDVAEPTEAVLEVFESSAEDGSALHMVEIPLTLLP